ncbi:hypothetical protein RCO27_08830 [Sphingosinicella sp. LHD-64]|uniref:hypothetical protein n=1 Tax=Sphingosinicella sp. LHD-64 TaxID=3072139 RepID=UPI00280D93DF|nr:hypothetical protein [Sphingosinicella sp. LHD-64]MDQ8756332.1 hypothetical protein [Sphingosinicella sp. LHD-64]
MRLTLKLAGLGLALTLGACGGGNDNSGGLTREEERQLDNAAAMLEDNVFDASADSLVANEADLGAAEDGAVLDNESVNSQ